MKSKLIRWQPTVALAALSFAGFAALAEDNAEIAIPLKDLPASVLATAETEAAKLGASLHEAEMEVENGQKIYSIEAKTASGTAAEFEIDLSGKLLKIEKDDGDHDDEESVEIPTTQLPAAVQSTVQTYAKGAQVTRAEKEMEHGTPIYEIKFQAEGTQKSLSITESGVLVELESAVSTSSLPAAVSSALTAKFPTGQIRKAESVQKHYFEFDIIVSGKKKEVKVDPSGHMFGEEDEDDD